MKPTKAKKSTELHNEARGLKTLRIATLIMMAIMTTGFVIIISVLTLEINAYFKKTEGLDLPRNITIKHNEKLIAITYLPEHTLVFIDQHDKGQIIRIISSKTGKILGDRLLSEVVNQESDD